ncbi:hypothetical protein A0J61_06988 [Choanephora cucurbitarum]|uniref:Uncharacterized protein n=1 Tax=Choanephora cucurbitarum TaxID=101091 RepID=A0A1C7N786_9FUNG|nr:hypothetical protein A0J61_06988 [Choanephora cucurbitarum]
MVMTFWRNGHSVFEYMCLAKRHDNYLEIDRSVPDFDLSVFDSLAEPSTNNNCVSNVIPSTFLVPTSTSAFASFSTI